jgi:uncharacterized YccA/Bax inhibitor family protein
MRTANPALSDRTFGRVADVAEAGAQMTVEGAVNKIGFVFLLLLASAAYTWSLFVSGNPMAMVLMVVGGLGGFLVAIVTIWWKPQVAPVTAPIYGVLEGFLIGGLSAMFEAQYPGIVTPAVALTLGTLLAMLCAYRSGLIKVTDKFIMGVAAATGGILLVYLLSFVLSFFGVGVPYIHGSGPIGILFSVFVVVVAALNLVLDFSFIENGARRGAPKYMEWYAALALMVTLVWLYIEILRLLSKLRSR